MGNKRLYYAIKQIGIKADTDGTGYDADDVVFGAQDISVSTNFNLTQIFEIGQLDVYQSLEELPDIEVSASKILDGKPLLWHMSTLDATAPDLPGRSNSRCSIAMAMFPDTNNSATGTPTQIMQSSGLYPKGLSYNIGVDGAFTESLTWVGNDKIFSVDPKMVASSNAEARAIALKASGFAGAFTGNNDTPNKIYQKESINFDMGAITTLDINGSVADPDMTILPYEVDGISSSGTNDTVGGLKNSSIQSIAISTDLGRESINQLGTRGPYHRYASFPVEVTCAIEALSLSGDGVSATEAGIYTTGNNCQGLAANLKDRTIRIAMCGTATSNGTRIYLGPKNRLSSVDFGGGTTDGGNDTNTYNFTNSNRLTVMADYDPHGDSATWWTARSTYLADV